MITGLAAEAEPVYSGASGHPDLWRPCLQHPLQRYCLLLRRRGPRLQLFARKILSCRRVCRLRLRQARGGRVRPPARSGQYLHRTECQTVWVLCGVEELFRWCYRRTSARVIGGADGTVGDLEAYMPLPGSSKGFVMFLGPSITWANHSYLQKVYGVTQGQSLASGDPIFNVHGRYQLGGDWASVPRNSSLNTGCSTSMRPTAGCGAALPKARSRKAAYSAGWRSRSSIVLVSRAGKRGSAAPTA